MDEIKFKRDKRSPTPKNERTSKMMSRIKAQNTTPEIILRKHLYKMGIRGYRLNYAKLPGKPDIAFIKRRILIFIHGCFWHGCLTCGRRIPKHNQEYWETKINKNILRDKKSKLELERMGFTVIEVWEHQIKNELKHVLNSTIKILNDN